MNWISLLVILCLICSCVNNSNFDAIKTTCTEEKHETVISLDSLKRIATENIKQFLEEGYIEAYVISSDQTGNFYTTLHFQDQPESPSGGFQLEIERTDYYLFYGIGEKVSIYLKDLYIQEKEGILKIGGVFTSYGNLSVGRLPSSKLSEHLAVICENNKPIVPQSLTIDSLTDDHINTLVSIENVEFLEEQSGLPYADIGEETERILTNCNGENLIVLNSGYADFQSDILPSGNGHITGVLLKDGNDYQLVIRDVNDINFSNDRCPPDEFTSTQIFFSELADPDNNSGARFIELYNASSEELSLKNWKILRYTNANTEVSSEIDLSGYSILPQSTFLISTNQNEFETVYGFAPHMEAGINSPADSNGDDTLVLVDPFGTIIDIFGVVGEDGSGTNHEFEDGRALRNSFIEEGNPEYMFSEWIIYNDTGAEGTTNLPQNAPEDFSPGLR